jgi:hypothetical protein
MPVDGLTGLIFALEAEEGIIFAAFIETDHACFFLI